MIQGWTRPAAGRVQVSRAARLARRRCSFSSRFMRGTVKFMPHTWDRVRHGGRRQLKEDELMSTAARQHRIESRRMGRRSQIGRPGSRGGRHAHEGGGTWARHGDQQVAPTEVTKAPRRRKLQDMEKQAGGQLQPFFLYSWLREPDPHQTLPNTVRWRVRRSRPRDAPMTGAP